MMINPLLHKESYEFKQILTTPNKAPTYVTISIITFIISKSLFKTIAPNILKSSQNQVTIWKFVNTANSLVHSFITGIGAVICIILHPSIPLNVISTYSDYSHRLVCYSVGYFIFDFFDMIFNHRKRSSYELMVHHLFVLFCFTLSITTRYYLAFTIISLTIEVNSIFLHIRQLLILTKTPKSNRSYKIISTINIITFLIFRIFVLSWMTNWMNNHRDLVNPAPFALGVVSVLVLMVMSIVLFFRLVRADFVVVDNNKIDSCFVGDNNNFSCGESEKDK